MRPSCSPLELYLCHQDKTPSPPATASPPQPTTALPPGQPPPGRGANAGEPTQTRGAQHGSPSPLALCCHGKAYYAADQASEERVSVPFCSPAATFCRPAARPWQPSPPPARKAFPFFIKKAHSAAPALQPTAGLGAAPVLLVRAPPPRPRLGGVRGSGAWRHLALCSAVFKSDLAQPPAAGEHFITARSWLKDIAFLKK